MDRSRLAGDIGQDGRSAAAFFADLSRQLMRQPQEEVTFELIANGAVDVVPAADHCGISLRRRKHQVESAATDDRLAAICDELQYELDEGPCLEAVWDAESFLANDIAQDRRWPRWGPRVADLGVGAVLSIRLSTSTQTLGAMNLYAERPHAFTDEDVDLATIFGAHAANAMNAARLVSGLEDAVASRHLIGVAQGILMHRYDLTLEQSFDVLRRYSSHLKVKLRDLAASVVEAGRLPGSSETPES